MIQTQHRMWLEQWCCISVWFGVFFKHPCKHDMGFGKCISGKKFCNLSCTLVLIGISITESNGYVRMVDVFCLQSPRTFGFGHT